MRTATNSAFGGACGCATLSLLVIAASVRADVCPPDIVSYWKFDDAAGLVASDTADGNNGLLVNGPVWTAGKVGSALELDGVNDYVTLPGAAANLKPTDAITLEVWLKPSNLVQDQHIFSTAGAGPSPLGHDYYLRLAQFVGPGGLEFRVNDNPLTADNALPVADEWYHVVATYDRTLGVRAIYVNGALIASNSYALPINTGHSVVTIGVNGRAITEGFPAKTFDGVIDETAIYARALTAAEVLQHYERGLAGSGYCVVDSDSDGIADSSDNCPAVYNPDQTDNEADGSGDACDADDDNDGVLDPNDNCPLVGNADQADSDADGAGDACDADLDGDGYDNSGDNCPTAANADQTDTDADGEGDECDLNDDGDAFLDAQDNCPSVPNDAQDDLDADGIGDVCDADLDGDGVANQADNCPIDPNVGQDDADADGYGDVCDSDDDGDGVADSSDNCPLVANPDQNDADSDGAGDACDADLDGDGIANGADNCPQVANPDQRDLDVDGFGDSCDPDVDGDGVANAADACAGTPSGAVTDSTGCSIAQLVPCSGPAGTVMPWRNHGKYLSATTQAVKRFVEAGLVTPAQADAVISAAAQSSCGKP